MGKDSLAPVIIIDASVIVNFLRVDRVKLLARLPYRLYITDHVKAEISGIFREQKKRLNVAERTKIITEYRVESLDELTLVATICRDRKCLGRGEASAMAAAVHNKWAFGVDDKAAKNHCKSKYPDIPVFGTADLIVKLIHRNVLTIEDADGIKDDWAKNHSFCLTIKTFQDLL